MFPLKMTTTLNNILSVVKEEADFSEFWVKWAATYFTEHKFIYAVAVS